MQTPLTTKPSRQALARWAELAILLAIGVSLLAVVWLRARKDLLIGAAGFAVSLIVEAYLGGLVGAHSKLTSFTSRSGWG